MQEGSEYLQTYCFKYTISTKNMVSILFFFFFLFIYLFIYL